MLRLPGPLRPLFPAIKRAVVRVNRRAAPVTRRVSRVFGSAALPPRSAWETADYASNHPESGVVVTQLEPPEQLARELPRGHPADHWVFEAHRAMTTTPVFLADVPGGSVVGHYGAILAADRTLLFDLSPYFGAFTPDSHPIYLRLRLPKPQHVPGTVAALTTRGVDNYCHFLLDVIPRIRLLEKAGLRAEVDRYVVNCSLPFQRDLLAMMGVTADAVIESRSVPHLRSDRVIAPSLAGYDLHLPSWVVPFLRERLLPPVADAAGPTRIYVSRGRTKNTRSVVNEDAVLDVLAAYGVEPVQPERLPVAEQIRLFSRAELVVAPHGAALTNIVFCRPDTAVVELFAPDYVNSCFWALANQVEGVRYRYLVGEGQGPAPGELMLGVASDIVVSPTRLAGLLDELAL